MTPQDLKDLQRYQRNTGAIRFWKDMRMSDSHQSYRDEKWKSFRRGISHYVAELDELHLSYLADAITDHAGRGME